MHSFDHDCGNATATMSLKLFMQSGLHLGVGSFISLTLVVGFIDANEAGVRCYFHVVCRAIMRLAVIQVWPGFKLY